MHVVSRGPSHPELVSAFPKITGHGEKWHGGVESVSKWARLRVCVFIGRGSFFGRRGDSPIRWKTFLCRILRSPLKRSFVTSSSAG